MQKHDFDQRIDRRNSDSCKWNQYPPDVLPMWVADADFTVAEPLVRALQERVAHGVFGYSQPDKEWRRAVAHWMRSRFDWPAREEWVAFSPSVVTALALCVSVFTEPGENVLFLSPSYPPFYSVPRNLGRSPVTSALVPDNCGYCIDFADLEAKMAGNKTRLFVLCNPHNPTGRVFSRRELLRLGELCLKHNLLIVSDEIHCDFVHPGRRHIPFPSLSEELARRTLVTLNPSKTFNIADLHASALIIPDTGLRERFNTAASALSLHSSALGLIAMRTAYLECAWYADQVAAYVKDNIDLAVEFINTRLSGIRAGVPEATFLLWLDCRDLGLSQPELESAFLNGARLALQSGFSFGPEGEGFMRMNLACPRSTLREALDRLERAFRA